jgi:hypothetical protein
MSHPSDGPVTTLEIKVISGRRDEEDHVEFLVNGEEVGRFAWAPDDKLEMYVTHDELKIPIGPGGLLRNS